MTALTREQARATARIFYAIEQRRAARLAAEQDACGNDISKIANQKPPHDPDARDADDDA